MSDRYRMNETSEPQEGWLREAPDEPIRCEQAEIVYAAARDVLDEAGVPYPRAVHLAEAIRKRVMGL